MSPLESKTRRILTSRPRRLDVRSHFIHMFLAYFTGVKSPFGR